MSLLEECYASGRGELVDTIEARKEGGTVSHLYCSGYQDRICGTEDGRVLTFVAMAMDLALPKNDNSAFQNLILGLDNVTGEVQEVVEEAKADGDRFIITFRRYLAEDLSYPAERYRMTLLSREYEDDVAKLTAGFYDLLNTTGNRLILTATRAPGLKYV
ncbi:DUF1833 domain-containing protein [Pseudomonas asiatica]|uniref:DUF1833 family protein n=1 Tax=Pseudomonas asiatica TaxID=2219225 RepID=UPI001E547BC9|nr:DUF1833 family protein [Pseudomonas asiatica]MCE0757097.1 DUF1833 domain-containing protein [Pseudomonas asiatica]MCE1032733.1 DUF1833 domain-containing protein [Pseudomonas asiatica]MCE1067432.1 DUF1833 domain-containing protein [Pseudomonas asiatica]MCE1102081.1 DUF1833 domain-containing protein [Pseudomonas asiatica]MCE1107636.1 DUF1833 domain-containing protein [Pseudomonas asiatica]